MLCDSCDSQTTLRHVKKRHMHKGRLYIVENVAAEVCQECGERQFHATTLDAIEQLLESEHPIKETLQVEVVTM